MSKQLDEQWLNHTIVGIIISGFDTEPMVLSELKRCFDGRYDIDTVKPIIKAELINLGKVVSIEDHKTKKAHHDLLNMGKVDALHMCSNSFVHMLGNIYSEYEETGELSTNTRNNIKEIYNNWGEIENDIRELP